MAKLYSCGVLVVALGAGIVGTRYFKSAPASPKIASPSNLFDIHDGDAAPRRLSLEEALTLDLSKSNSTNRQAVDANEPIVTRLESLDEPPETPMNPATAFGGAEEGDADALRAPRPDIETRLMPYADDEAETPLSRLFRWTGLGRPAPKSIRVEPTIAEESEEPPILEPVLPTQHHPQNCPYGGHCPYPYSYRSMQPR